MEFRQLRYFMAVANHLHFTRAAEHLGMAQPPLSQQILKLEREIGTPLFRRLTRGVELTEAGELFKQDAQRLLDAAELTLTRVQSVARGHIGRIALGFAGSVVFHPLVARVVRDFRQDYPGVSISSLESNSVDLARDLREGGIDAAFIRLPADCSGLKTERLVAEGMLAVLPITHPLADGPRFNLAELAGETLVMFPRQIGPHLYDSIINACLRAGFSPNLGQESPQISSTISMVAAGFGVALIPQSLSHVHAQGVTHHEIRDDSLTTTIALVCRAGERSRAVLNLLAQVRRVRERAPDPVPETAPDAVGAPGAGGDALTPD